MTYSDCWISTVDDAEFRAFLASQPDTEHAGRLDLLPPPPTGGYWINIVHRWAANMHSGLSRPTLWKFKLPCHAHSCCNSSTMYFGGRRRCKIGRIAKRSNICDGSKGWKDCGRLQFKFCVMTRPIS